MFVTQSVVLLEFSEYSAAGSGPGTALEGDHTLRGIQNFGILESRKRRGSESTFPSHPCTLPSYIKAHASDCSQRIFTHLDYAHMCIFWCARRPRTVS